MCFTDPTAEVASSSSETANQPEPTYIRLSSISPPPPPALSPRLKSTIQPLPPSSSFFLPVFNTAIWQGEADQHGPTALQRAARSVSLSWCCWESRPWESPAWCCASSKASSTSTRRAPSEVRGDGVFSCVLLDFQLSVLFLFCLQTCSTIAACVFRVSAGTCSDKQIVVQFYHKSNCTFLIISSPMCYKQFLFPNYLVLTVKSL